MAEPLVFTERFEALERHKPEVSRDERTAAQFRRAMGHPPIGSAENVALIIATALDQQMAEAIDAGLTVLCDKLRAAFEQAVRDCQEEEVATRCSQEQ